MSVASRFYSLRFRFLKLLSISCVFFISHEAWAVKDCGETHYNAYIKTLNAKCSGPQATYNAATCAAEAKCQPHLMHLVRQCQNSIATDLAAASTALASLEQAQVGNWDGVKKGSGNLQSTTTASGAQNAPQGGGVCTAYDGAFTEGKINQARAKAVADSGISGSGAAQTGAAAGSLLGKAAPLLIGAGLGGLVGYMLGGDDEGSNASTTPETPPVLPPPPPSDPGGSSSSNSTSSTASSGSSSSSGITTPAIVRIPTVDSNDEAGDDDSEILVSANDAIVEDDDSGATSSTTSSSSGGTTGVGGTTGGGSTGNGSQVADVDANNGDDGSGRDVENVNVEDDESIVGLVGAQRTGASLVNYNSGAGAQSSAVPAVGGSNMVLGAPTKKTVSRSLAGSSSSKATAAQASSTSSLTSKREQIRADLRRRGLIK